MGLLKRARSLPGASRSDPQAHRGLLGRSLELVDKLLPRHPTPAIEQSELDAPAAATLRDIPVGVPKKSPETIPRTWKESGQSAPPKEEETPVASKPLTKAQRRERLWAGLKETEDGIESPGRLFSLLKEELGLERAAMLLYDPVRMTFAPWAVHGFDETTRHRLRIPLGANDTMNRLAGGKVFLLSNPEELQPFHQFFSFREFSTLSGLLLLPFISESKFMGLLLAANPDQTDLEMLKTLSSRVSSRLYAARERHLEGAKRGTPQHPESLQESVQAALQPCLEKNLSPGMIQINTANLLETAKKHNPYIDSFRLKQDISRVVLSLFQPLGQVLQVDGDRMLILITDAAHPIQEGDHELLIYHLKSTLGRLLPELAEQEKINLNEQVRIPILDMEEALTYLAEIV
jgi:hypothetical protein